jgi:SAM-dependent methyltransferase
MVERFGSRWITGWVAVPTDAPPVRISLRVNKFEVATTWATAGSTDRNNWGDVRDFGFRIRDIWSYVRKTDRLSVRANGKPLPIYHRGMYVQPSYKGQQSLRELKAEFALGKVFAQNGRLQLSKTLDTVWQAQVMALYDQVRTILAEAHGLDAFFIYGTLLGAVREGAVIGHDTDFDAAFISSQTDPRSAAREMQQVAFTLIDAGMDVECLMSALHIHDRVDPAVRIDLFHLFFDGDGKLQFPFGIAGHSTYSVDQWKGTEEIAFAGARGLVPVDAEPLVEYIYGAGWREPKPGFDWVRDRVEQAIDGFLPPEWVEEVYWANFYAHTEYTSGSSFCELVDGRLEVPQTVVDIGCGDGRDSCWFAKSGRHVMGLDRSHIGIRHAAAKATSLGLADLVEFRACDVSDGAALRAALADARTVAAGGPLLFYLRFFLHSVPEEVQETLLAVITECASPGDMFAAEFRSEADEELPKTFMKHYRRFQSGRAFGVALHERYGFEILDEVEGTGLAVYGDEDPVIYRVIAVRQP